MPIYRADEPGLPGAPAWLRPYRPLLRQGDLQTIIARYWPARWDEARFPTESRFLSTDEGVRTLAKINRIGAGRTLLMVHGLTACSEARYMLSLAQRALESGFNTVRLNVRNCGGTEHLCPTLYHSGLTVDLRAAVEQLSDEPLYVLGFSMGGNMALKLAGEWGESPPAHVRGVCGVSVPIRLDLCSRRIGEFRNRVYEVRFLRQLRATLALKKRLQPEIFAQIDGARSSSIWDFDHQVTAPAFGFQSAADYYARASSAGFLERIRLPTLLIEAEDDPFIPWSVYAGDPAFGRNPYVHLAATRHGGHVAFLSSQGPRFWAEEQALRFFETLDEGGGAVSPLPA
ncbi:MAG: alpha/beta fold hydrolase [Acidobacteria bacterium]|nr:alpha/beta fold hydrolase [Acidobacteriota bacterium]